jgi:hypothetical protein
VDKNPPQAEPKKYTNTANQVKFFTHKPQSGLQKSRHCERSNPARRLSPFCGWIAFRLSAADPPAAERRAARFAITNLHFSSPEQD